MKNYEIRAFFEPQILTNPILTIQYYIEQPNTMFSEKGSDVIFLERFFLIMGRPWVELATTFFTPKMFVVKHFRSVPCKGQKFSPRNIDCYSAS